ncbi:MAG: hypothetical protein OEY52_04860 [Gammaproteobacteria bacterium]|nr:hypothetical protein [Gammaproteobacteria bacterium]
MPLLPMLNKKPKLKHTFATSLEAMVLGTFAETKVPRLSGRDLTLDQHRDSDSI